VLAASPSAVISPCLRPLHVRFAWARSRHVIVDCNAGDGGGAAAARHGREIEEAGLTESERESAAPASRAPTVVVLSHHVRAVRLDPPPPLPVPPWFAASYSQPAAALLSACTSAHN
jgi:hypothetical protein